MASKEVVSITSKSAIKHLKRAKREPEALSGIYSYSSPSEEILIEITADDMEEYRKDNGGELLPPDVLSGPQAKRLLGWMKSKKQIGRIG